MAILKKPWLHFIFLGVVFYQIQAVMLPDPKVVIGPISKARIKALEEQWFVTTSRHPNAQQRASLIELELNRDMLLQHALESEVHRNDSLIYQRLIRNMQFLQLGEGKSDNELFEQALEMQLHLDDEVVRQRLVQVIEQKLLAENPPLPVTDQQVMVELESRLTEFRQPSRYSFEHLYFSLGQEAEAQAVITRISEENLDFLSAKDLGSPFIEGQKFTSQSPAQLRGIFGTDFVESLRQATAENAPVADQWYGPVQSAYGQHYLWMNEFEPARDARLEEVGEKLRRTLANEARELALQEAISSLREQYDVRRQDIWVTTSDANASRDKG